MLKPTTEAKTRNFSTDSDKSWERQLNNDSPSFGNASMGLHAALRSAMQSAEQELAQYLHLRESMYIQEICRLHRRLEVQVTENKRLAKRIDVQQPHTATMAVDDLKMPIYVEQPHPATIAVDDLNMPTRFGVTPQPTCEFNGLKDELLAPSCSIDESGSSFTVSGNQSGDIRSLNFGCLNFTKLTGTRVPPLDLEEVVIGPPELLMVGVVEEDVTFQNKQEKRTLGREQYENVTFQHQQKECNKQRDTLTQNQMEALERSAGNEERFSWPVSWGRLSVSR